MTYEGGEFGARGLLEVWDFLCGSGSVGWWGRC